MDTHTILEQSKLTVTLNINLTQEQETHSHGGVSRVLGLSSRAEHCKLKSVYVTSRSGAPLGALIRSTELLRTETRMVSRPRGQAFTCVERRSQSTAASSLSTRFGQPTSLGSVVMSSILAKGYSSKLLAGCTKPCRRTARTVGGKTTFLGARNARVASSGRRNDLGPVLMVGVCTAPTTPPRPGAAADGLALTPGAAAVSTLRAGCVAVGDRGRSECDERGAASEAGGGMGAAAVVGVGGGCEEVVPSLGVGGICIRGTPGESAADGPGTTDVDGVSWLDGRPGVRGTGCPAVGCRYARTLPSGSNCSSGSAAKPPPAGSHILSCRSPLFTLHDSSRCRLSAPTVLMPPGTLTVWPPSRATLRVPTIPPVFKHRLERKVWATDLCFAREG